MTKLPTDILSVQQLNRQVKRLLEAQFASVWVEGELSTLSCPASGHWYFTLKDKHAQIRCAMFRSANSRCAFTPNVGQQVIVRAKLSLFEARGDYQLLVERLLPAGDGAWMLAFEQCKAKLQAEGLFDLDNKQTLPTLPNHIAVLTSPTGAVIHDILTLLADRFPAIKVSLVPIPVQGKQAAGAIIKALANVNRWSATQKNPVDVILLARGGGSIEDLWTFNEESVARAIAASALPIVSAIGHESDVTIADLVADHRSATPSAAAVLLSPDRQEWWLTLQAYQQHWQRLITQHLHNAQQQCDLLSARLPHPSAQLRAYQQRFAMLAQRLHAAYLTHHRHTQHRLTLCTQRLLHANPSPAIVAWKKQVELYHHTLVKHYNDLLINKQSRLQLLIQRLDANNPLTVLKRGYAVVSCRDSGHVIHSSTDTAPNDILDIRLASGRLSVTVSQCLKK